MNTAEELHCPLAEKINKSATISFQPIFIRPQRTQIKQKPFADKHNKHIINIKSFFPAIGIEEA